MSNKYASIISSHKFLTDSSFPRQPVSTLLRKRMIRKAANPNSWPQSVDDVLFSDQLWKRKDIELLLRNPTAIRYIPETTINRIAGAISSNAMSYRNQETNQLAQDLVNQWDFLSSQPFKPVVQRKRYVAQGDILDFNPLDNGATTTNGTQPSVSETKPNSVNVVNPVRRAATVNVKDNIMASQSTNEIYGPSLPIDPLRRNRAYTQRARFNDRGAKYKGGLTPNARAVTRMGSKLRQEGRNYQNQAKIILSDVPYGPKMRPELEALAAKDPVAFENWQRVARINAQREAALARRDRESGVDPVIRMRENIYAGKVNPTNVTNSFVEANEPTVYPKGVQLLATADGYTNFDAWLANIDTLSDKERQAAYGKIKNVNMQAADLTPAEFKRLLAEAEKTYLAGKERTRANVDATYSDLTGPDSPRSRAARTRATTVIQGANRPGRQNVYRPNQVQGIVNNPTRNAGSRSSSNVRNTRRPSGVRPMSTSVTPKEYSLTRLARFGAAKAKQTLRRNVNTLRGIGSQISNTPLGRPVRAIGSAINRLPRKAKIGLGIGAALLGGNALMNKRATISKSAKMTKNHHNKYF